jgi:rhodanese-related sulfurtransferase
MQVFLVLCKYLFLGLFVSTRNSIDFLIVKVIVYSSEKFLCLTHRPGLIGCLEAIETMKLLMLISGVDKSSMPLEPVQPLFGRQLFYSATDGEFHTFSLPTRDPACLVCSPFDPKIKNMEDSRVNLQTMLEANSVLVPAVPELGPEYRISASQFAQQCYGNAHPISAEGAVPPLEHVVLDVRSRTQHEIVNLRDFYIANQGAYDALSLHPQGVAQVKQINIPLQQLKGGVRQDEASRASEMSLLRNLQGEHGTIFVLCRRGIDSVTASQLLVAHGFNRVLNVDGGLDAWNADVDSTFPRY